MSRRTIEDELAEIPPSKETIILVHGTFAAPTDGVLRWYQHSEENNFVKKLDDALEKLDSTARCWKHIEGGQKIFSWSGNNSWIDRMQASKQLYDELKELTSRGWRAHLVCHSHGGNIAVDALRLWIENSGPLHDLLSISTLGTPFIDNFYPVMSRYNNFLRHARNRFNVFLIFSMVLFTLLVGDLDAYLLTVQLMFGSMAIFWNMFPYLSLAHWRFAKHQKSPKAMRWLDDKLLLAITSAHDEVFLLLAAIRNSKNPLKPERGLLRTIVSDALQRRRLINPFKLSTDKLPASVKLIAFLMLGLPVIVIFVKNFSCFYGITSSCELDQTPVIFFGLIMLGSLLGYILPGRAFQWPWEPFFWLRAIVASIQSLGTLFVSHQFRCHGWQNIQKIAMGCEGYPHRLPRVRRTPFGFPRRSMQIGYLEECSAESTLVARWQSLDGWARTQGNSSLTGHGIMHIDIIGELKRLAADLNLIHAAYFSDQETIDQIAKWIKQHSLKNELTKTKRMSIHQYLHRSMNVA
jgi:hypothetical protein